MNIVIIHVLLFSLLHNPLDQELFLIHYPSMEICLLSWLKLTSASTFTIINSKQSLKIILKSWIVQLILVLVWGLNTVKENGRNLGLRVCVWRLSTKLWLRDQEH